MAAVIALLLRNDNDAFKYFHMRVLFHPVKGVGILQNCILFNPIIHNRKTASHWMKALSCGLS